MPFRVGGDTYFMYLNVEGRADRLSTGTRLLARAREIERAIKSLGPRGTNDREILSALAGRRLTVPQVFDAIQTRTLDQLRAQLRDVDLAAPDADGKDLVAQWAATLTLRPRTQREYLATVRKVIPAGEPFPASRFTKGLVQRYLDRWVTGSRNRYRSQLSHFAKWLVAREVIPYNPVLQTVRATEAEPRVVWYTPEQAQTLIRALPMPFQALEALMAGCAIDLGAALQVTRNDVNEDRRTVFSHGPADVRGRLKTRHRVRDCVVTEGWCWDIFWSHAQTFVGGARLFQHAPRTVQGYHREAVAATKLHPSWPRDWRHSFAVWHRLRGTPDWQIAAYLGHGNTVQVQICYARFKPTTEQLSYKHHEGRG